MKNFFLLIFVVLSFSSHSVYALSDSVDSKDISYIFALSWSPTYCQDDAAKKNIKNSSQCRVANPYKFVVHGLWPLHKNYCNTLYSQPDYLQISRMRSLMPDDGLIKYQWRKHGTCSGKNIDDYFSDIENARMKITIPQSLETISASTTFTKYLLRDEFVKANPRLDYKQFTLHCSGNKLKEVRVCMSQNLEFENCRKTKDSCPDNNIIVPLVL